MNFKVVNAVVPVTKETFQSVMAKPDELFQMMQLDFRQIAETTLSTMLRHELTAFLGREAYIRTEESAKNHRNGSYERKFAVKNLGELKIQVPRDRNGEYQTEILEKYQRYDQGLKRDVCMMFLSGCSTRGIELMSETLIGRRVSRGEVSSINNEMMTGIDKWRSRDLSAFKVKYMYLDGVFFKMRVERKIERIPMLVVIGVTEENRRIFLCIQQGDKDSAGTWREIFRDMKQRGLDSSAVKLGVMDGLAGLSSVFSEEFRSAKVQRCQVHVARNVLCKVPKAAKQQVADAIRSIFYAPSRQSAREQYETFYESYQTTYPSAVKCLGNVLDECLTYLSFPDEDWVSLRTTNPIERVNKEFKRRTNSMEILAGEKSAYRLLCFVALKMEIYWQRSPTNRAPNQFELPEFTQSN
jgi:putative transposase